MRRRGLFPTLLGGLIGSAAAAQSPGPISQGSPPSVPTLLAKGDMTGLAYVDFVLPSDYSYFQLQFSGVQTSDLNNATLAAALSADSGATFWNDANNGDTYVWWGFLTGGNTDPDTGYDYNGSNQKTSKGLIEIGGSGHTPWAEFRLDPGVTGQRLAYFSMESLSGDLFGHPTGSANTTNGAGSITGQRDVGVVSIQATALSGNPAAILHRANLLRVMPFGNGDANPPTSGNLYVSGSHAFWGYK